MVRSARQPCNLQRITYNCFMPIFEYVCNDCNNSFEKLVIGNAEPECPSCHSKKLSVFSASTKSSGSAPQLMGGCCGGGACGLPGPCDN